MNRDATKWYDVRKKPSGSGYDVYCLLCNKKSVAWDYRNNATKVGMTHIVMEHTAPLYRHADWIEDDA